MPKNIGEPIWNLAWLLRANNASFLFWRRKKKWRDPFRKHCMQRLTDRDLKNTKRITIHQHSYQETKRSDAAHRSPKHTNKVDDSCTVANIPCCAGCERELYYIYTIRTQGKSLPEKKRWRLQTASATPHEAKPVGWSRVSARCYDNL